MKFSIAQAIALFSVLLVSCSGSIHHAQAQETPPDEFVLQVGKNQRRLDGIISSVNPNRNSFVLDAYSISYPTGRPNALDTSQSVVVTTHPDTYFHVRGDSKPDVSFEDVQVGDSAVVIASFSTTEQKWSAVEVSLWTKIENKKYVLEGKKEPSPLPSGLVAWWKGEGGRSDTSGQYSGSPVNGVTFGPGFVGQSLRFDGDNDIIAVADAPAFALTHSISVEGWVYVMPPLKYRFGVILSRAATRGTTPYMLAVMQDGTANFSVENDKSQRANLNAPMPGRRWVHLAGTLDDATGRMCLYVNGVLAAEQQTEVRPGNNVTGQKGASIGIGNYASRKGLRTFSGLIDELSLYDRALSAKEVEGIYNARTAGKTLPLATPITLVP